MQTKKYITQAGESLMGISARELGDELRWREIQKLNSDTYKGMAHFSYYPVGSEIDIPIE